jgi:hypothetical protein
MNDAQITFIVESCIFGVAAIVTFCLWVWFIRNGYVGIAKETESARKKLSKHKYHIHWLRSIWIHASLFACNFVFLIYYVTASVGAGIAPTPNGDAILWSRWLVVGLVRFIIHICLSFILTHHIGDHKANGSEYYHNSSVSVVQTMWILLFDFLSIATMFFATLSTDRSVQIALIVFAPIAQLLSLFGYLFPFNKLLFIKSNEHDSGILNNTKCRGVKEKSNHDRILIFQRCACLIFLILSFLIGYIVWILSSSNTITNVINFRSEIITLAFSDDILLIPFCIIMLILPFAYKQKSVEITDTKTGQVTYASRAHQD